MILRYVRYFISGHCCGQIWQGLVNHETAFGHRSSYQDFSVGPHLSPGYLNWYEYRDRNAVYYYRRCGYCIDDGFEVHIEGDVLPIIAEVR